MRFLVVVIALVALSLACPPRPTSCKLPPPSEAALFSNVCLHGGTEERQDRCNGVPPALGNFTCACCGNALFAAADKCHSGTGWPSFTASVGTCITPKYEVVCGRCGAHLGDYFDEYVAGDCVVNGQPSRFCIDGVCLKPPAGSVYGAECTAPTAHPTNPALSAPAAQSAVAAMLQWAVAHANSPADYGACRANVNQTLGAQTRKDGSLLVVFNVTQCAGANASFYPKDGLMSAVVDRHGAIVQTPWGGNPTPAPTAAAAAASSPYTAAFGVPVALAFLGVAVLGFVAGKILRKYYDPDRAQLVVLDDSELAQGGGDGAIN